MQFVSYQVDGGVAEIRLDRPDRLNAVGLEMLRDLSAAVVMFASDPRARIAILTGEGRGFCAGRDLKEEARTGAERYGEQSYPRVLNRQFLIDTEKILIVAVHGLTVGQGFYLVLGCDYRIADETARFWMPEIETGVLGPFDLGLYENVPWAIAAEITLLGRRLSAERLYQVGMLNEVVPAGTHLRRAQEVADEFLQLPADVLAATKRLMIRARPDGGGALHAEANAERRQLRNNAARVRFVSDFAAGNKPE